VPLFRKEILDWVAEHPDCSCAAISDGTNIGPIGVERLMREAYRDGVVTRTRYDRRSGYLYRTAEPPALDLSAPDEE